MAAMKKYLSSGENLKQQQARRLKIRRGLDAAKAAKALDPGSQNETGGVDARTVRFREDSSIHLNDTQQNCLNPQVSTNEVASLNNQLGLTPLADIRRECSFLERYGDYCQGYFYGRTFLINGCCPVHECIVVKSYRNLNLNDPNVAISEHVVEINPVFVKAANDYLRGFCQLSLNWHGFVRYPNGAVFWGNFVEGVFDGKGLLMYPADDLND